MKVLDPVRNDDVVNTVAVDCWVMRKKETIVVVVAVHCYWVMQHLVVLVRKLRIDFPLVLPVVFL